MTGAVAMGGGAAAGGAGDALALVRLLREAVAAAAAREALHLRLGRFSAPPRQPHRGRLVEEALDLLRGASRVRVFSLPNADVVAVAPPAGAERLREAEAALRALLEPGDGGGASAPPAVARLRLPEEAAALVAAVEASLVPSPPAARPPGAPAAGGRRGGDAGGGFAAEDLAAMERGLAGADLSGFLRQRPVCRLGPADAGPEIAWREWRVALPEVFAALAPAADPAASPWLLRRLRRSLDRRLLSALALPDRAAALGAAALRLSPGSVETPEFARFAEALGPAGRALVAVGAAAEDALADPAGFAAARDRCRARGFRTALFGADAAALPLLPPRRLGLDLVHLRWSPGLPAAAAAALPAAGSGEVVLVGANTAAAVGWGWEHGVALFAGRLLRPRGG